MKVSVIVPAHNEIDNLRSTVKALITGLADSGFEKELIIVDDCSTDDTGALAEKLAAEEKQVKVVHRAGSPGFGLALKCGFQAATGDYIAPFMGDGSDRPSDLLRLVRKAEDGGYDIVLGTRWIDGGSVVGYPPLKMLFSKGFSFACRTVLRVKARDCSNAFRLYRRRVVEKLDISSSGFEISAEILVKAYRAGYSVAEVPVSWHGRSRGSSKLRYVKVGPKFIGFLFGFARARKYRGPERRSTT